MRQFTDLALGIEAPLVRRVRHERDYLPVPLDLRLVPAALSLWLGFLFLGEVGKGAAAGIAVVAGAGAAVATGIGRARRRRRRDPTRGHRLFPRGSAWAMLALVGVSLSIGFGLQAGRLELRDRDALALQSTQSGARFNVVVQVISTPRQLSFGGQIVTLQVRQFERHGRVFASGAKLRATGKGWEEIELGSWVRLRLGLRGRDPTGEYLGFAQSPTTPQVLAGPRARYRFVNWVRGVLRESSQAAGLSLGTQTMVIAMTLGFTGEQDQADKDAMQASGLAHLTAVSGMHLSVLVGVVLALTRGRTRLVQVAAAAVTIAVFLAMLEGSAAVTRAAAMGVITLVGLGLARPARSISSLCVAVIAMLLATPWQASSWGFALSVVATGSIVTLGHWLAGWMSRFLPRIVTYPLAVSLAAQLACSPLMLGMRGKLQVYALPANLLTGTVSSVVTIGGLVLVAVWGSRLGGLPGPGRIGNEVLARVTGAGADWVLGVARFFAKLPGAEVPWLEAAPGVVGVLLVTACLCWLTYSLSEKIRWKGS